MKALLRIGIVMALCGIALVELTLHNRSLKLTQRLHACEVHRQFLYEQRDSLLAEIARLSSFSRLESLWIAEGKPRWEETDGRQAVDLGQEPGPVEKELLAFQHEKEVRQ